MGCGFIGRRRAEVVRRSPDDQLVIVADVDEGRVTSLAREMGCSVTTDWREVVASDNVDAIIVCTTNKWLAPISIAALQNDKHVLVEKPMARNLAEAEKLLRAWMAENEKAKVENIGRKIEQGNAFFNFHRPLLAVGFNLRHHPAISKAHELCADGIIGPPMFIRAVYGHGGRPGYDMEWRADPELAGGGELLDQGIHLIDLCRWFLGDFSEAFGITATYIWGSKTTDRRQKIDEKFATSSFPFPISAIEDNAFALLRTATGQVASLHASWTQWKNRFSFEVFGRGGYLRVDGLGGSYGVERLEIGRRKGEGGPPEVEVLEFPGPDPSWQAEWQEFTAAIRDGRQPMTNGYDGWQAMRMISAVYESERTGKMVKL